ncbi:unnamed protein product [Prunus armeniaca]
MEPKPMLLATASCQENVVHVKAGHVGDIILRIDRTRPEFPRTRDEPCGDPGITPMPGSLLKTMSSFTKED